MATTAKKTTKKTATQEQIERLEKALENVKEEDVVNLIPEDEKAEFEADRKLAEKLENPENVDLDKEVRELFEKAEPSEEVKQQVREFEAGKEEFNKKLEKEPEKAEEIIKNELNRIEELKKRTEAMRNALRDENKRSIANEGFTNWWNGSSNLF